MKIEITQKELLQILNEKFNSEVEIDEVSIKVSLEKGFDDYITLNSNKWFVGSFLKEEIKNKGE